ncbi:Golgi-specific brefeldin A-resistance guanine nucleotide exchange factor 1 [Amphibalanus amphitrite]|uniref:Golgi-specific brefeldin A-resistance guanine nucleotide exchange factor 1 n=1 Tax=Amphibalanus amphitrite TaxID=1232801 RepID=A0A6A4XA07_AMPAM|nr:Golgi-specific brefeldin A-resistance guanine nucleotide exchange factor 1 [Amphibalanus amphitrite]
MFVTSRHSEYFGCEGAKSVFKVATMRPPGNILYIIQGEMSILLTAMRRGPRWSGYSAQQDEGQDSLLKAFAELKVILSHTEHWEDLDPSTVITPFLNVIRDNDTPGPVTGLALGAVNKLLSYNIIDPSLESAPAVMESIADAVTHARFVGTETSSDEVVLVKILQVLRTLLMIPSGYLLSNESVCEIMQSCFRLCFEPRLSELLRRSAEHILTDLTQLLFTRLAEMSEDDQTSSLARKLKMRSGSLDGRGKKKGKFPRLKYRRRQGEGKDAMGKEQGKDGAAVAGAVKKPDSLPVEPATTESQSEAGEQTSLETGTPSDRTPLATTPGVPKGAVVDLNHLDRVHVPETVRETPEEGPPVVPSTESTGEVPVEDGESATEGQRSGGDGAGENREVS